MGNAFGLSYHAKVFLLSSTLEVGREEVAQCCLLLRILVGLVRDDCMLIAPRFHSALFESR